MTKFVAYLRVSTLGQRKDKGAFAPDGLGIAAQMKTITGHMKGEPIAIFTESESGRRTDRPELEKALSVCRKEGAVLVVASLDRLSRSVEFVSAFHKSGVEFIACDCPFANKFVLHILAAVAEYESDRIRERTKKALQVLKNSGVRLGSHSPQVGSKAGGEATKQAAIKFREFTMPHIDCLARKGMSFPEIAVELNRLNIKTARGREWSPQGVYRMLGERKGED